MFRGCGTRPQKYMERIKRVYFLYELHTGIYLLQPRERYLFSCVLIAVLALLVFKFFY